MTLPIRRTDNLLISSGTFEGRQPQQWAPGDRADIVGKEYGNTGCRVFKGGIQN